VGEKAYFKWLLKRKQKAPFSHPLDFIKTIRTKAMIVGSLGGEPQYVVSPTLNPEAAILLYHRHK